VQNHDLTFINNTSIPFTGICKSIERDLTFEVRITNGSKEGMGIGYYADGTTFSEFSFKDNVANGTYKEYYDNGQLREESFILEGEKKGLCKRYSKDGKLISEKVY
jgi:antitoxin component YwqK of YwqJK toxin-antitoxin module